MPPAPRCDILSRLSPTSEKYSLSAAVQVGAGEGEPNENSGGEVVHSHQVGAPEVHLGEEGTPEVCASGRRAEELSLMHVRVDK